MTFPPATLNLYRAFSSSNTGGLLSRKDRGNGQLSHRELLSEFNNHRKIFSTQSTALISTTINFIDVLRRAFNKFYRGEMPGQIWIVFISVPRENTHTCHHAEHLAVEIGHENPRVFKNEYVFVWEIPARYIVHKISVQTPLDRGLDMGRYCRHSKGSRLLPPAPLLRQEIARDVLCPSNAGYDIGLRLGFMARNFGARAVGCNIAHRILFECTRVVKIDFDAQDVHTFYGDTGEEIMVDFEHFCSIDKGIDEALIDFWLTDANFCSAYAEHCEWVSGLKDEMAREWENYAEHMNNKDIACTEQLYQSLQARENEMNTEIETAATDLGL